MVKGEVYPWPGGLSNFETVNGGTEPVLEKHPRKGEISNQARVQSTKSNHTYLHVYQI